MSMRTLAPLALLVLATAARAGDREKVDNIFRVWDKDGDGVLTREEVPDDAIFRKVDLDRDGTITRDEVAVYVGVAPEGKAAGKAKAKAKKPPADQEPGKAKSEAAPPKEPRTVKERVEDFFRRFDANRDRRVQRGEYAAGEAVFKEWDRNRNDALSVREVTRYITATLREAKKRPTPQNFFDLFDMNRDKKVTRREYDGPNDFFRRYDHDKDRVITEEELNMGPDAGSVMEADREYMKDAPTEAPRTGMLERFDKDGDGRITLEELNNAETVLRRLDRNGDGVLSGSEVR